MRMMKLCLRFICCCEGARARVLIEFDDCGSTNRGRHATSIGDFKLEII